MSFILDALKKLEQKKQRDTVPDVMTVHIPEQKAQPRRSILFYLIVVALILNAAVLGLWLFPEKGEKDTSSFNIPVETHKTQDISAYGQKSSGQVDHESVSSQTETERHVSVEKSPDIPLKKTSTQRTDNEKEDSLPQTKKTDNKPAQEQFSRPTSQADNPAIVSTGSKSMPHKTDPSNTAKKETAASPSSAPGFKNSETGKAEYPNGIPELSQLPQNIQSEIPNMTILGHIYSDSSVTRMVNINGNIFREGDVIVKNIRIENITENGAVFEYNGLRFSIRAF